MTRRDLRLWGLLVAVPAALFLHPFLLGKTHAVGDVLFSFHPWLTFAAQELQRGRLPLWNPFAACGEPFLANPQLMTFFPPASFFWLFHFSAGWRMHLFMEQALLSTAAFLALRRLSRPGAALGALALTWGGFTVTLWEFPGALAAMPFVVLLLFFTVRRAWTGAAAATALLFFSGYTQFAYYALIAAGTLALARRRSAGGRAAEKAFGTWDFRVAAGFSLAVAAGILLALPQVLPTWEAVRRSIRAGLDAGLARQYLLTPVFLVKFLLPDLHDKVASPYAPAVFDGKLWPIARNWLNTFYVGLPVLLLAGVGAASPRRRRAAAWAGMAVAALLIAMGAEPLFSLFRWAVPGARYMTHFSNAVILVVIALAALAAEGARVLPERGKAALGTAALLGVVPLSILLLPSARLWTMARLLGVTALTAAQDGMVRASALKALILLSASAALLMLPRRRWAPLLALALLDLWLFGRDLHPLLPSDFFRHPVPLARKLHGTDARLSIDPVVLRDGEKVMDGHTLEEGLQSLRQALYPNLTLPFRIPHTWAYEVFAQSRFAEARHAIPLDRPLGPVLDFVGARDVLSTRPLDSPARFTARRNNILLYENPGARPRVTAVASARVISDDGHRLAYMASGWDPGREILLESGTEEEVGPVELRSWDEAPGKLRAAGRGAGWLVYSQIHYPGWEIHMDGGRADLLRADHAFMAARVPPGTWRAVFHYRPRLFRIGLAAACLLLIFSGAAGLRRLKSWAI